MHSAGCDLDVGIPEIDREHEAIFELSRELERSVVLDQPREEVRPLLSAVAAATKTHFENEERIMAPLHLKNEDRHKAEHRRLLQYLGDIYEKMNNPQENWRHQLSDINDLLFRHIIVFDMECKNHHP